jgi:hypothetical protein
MAVIAHGHGRIDIRFRPLFLLLSWLHLPASWLVTHTELPCDPECTTDMAVTRGEP